jgi:transcriptional regulator with XRE-family HTH domain
MPGSRGARSPNQTLRALRVQHALSQDDLAAAIRRAGWESCDRRTVQRWESGETASPQYGARRALEAVLRVPFSAMGFEDPEASVSRRQLLAAAAAGTAAGALESSRRGCPTAGPAGPDVPGADDLARDAALEAGDRAPGAQPARAFAPGVNPLAPLAAALLSAPADLAGARGGLADEVSRIWKLRQAARYRDLTGELPDALIRARSSVSGEPANDTLARLTALTHLYNAASSLAKSLGSFELAGIAAERAVQAADRTGDPLLAGAAAYRMANVLLSAGHLDSARAAAVSAADRLRPAMTATASHTSMWGALLATAAQAAARGHAVAEAWELLGASKVAADLLPAEQADLFSVFGTASWQIHAVSIAADTGDGTEAIRRASLISPRRLPPFLAERRTFLLLSTARGYALRSEVASAAETLLEAEQAAPEEVRQSAEARSLLWSLRPGSRGRAGVLLRELEARMTTMRPAQAR